MHATVRRLAIVGAISVFGAVGGIALGNFVADVHRLSGVDELAEYRRTIAALEEKQAAVLARSERLPATGARRGPISYQCEGCDAVLYPEIGWDEDIHLGDMADYTPLPPYRVYDPPEIARPAAPVTAPPAARADTAGAAAPAPALPLLTAPLMPE